MSCGIIRIGGNGAAEFFIGFNEIPVVVEVSVGERGVSFSERIIKLQRLQSRSFRLWTSFGPGQAKISAIPHSIRIRDAGIGEGVPRILVDRLLEIGKSLLHAFFGSLVPVVAPPEVKLIGLGVLGVTFRKLPLICAGQLDPQVVGDRFRDLLLKAEDV